MTFFSSAAVLQPAFSKPAPISAKTPLLLTITAVFSMGIITPAIAATPPKTGQNATTPTISTKQVTAKTATVKAPVVKAPPTTTKVTKTKVTETKATGKPPITKSNAPLNTKTPAKTTVKPATTSNTLVTKTTPKPVTKAVTKPAIKSSSQIAKSPTPSVSPNYNTPVIPALATPAPTATPQTTLTTGNRVADRIVAIVNDTPILQSQLDAAVTQATSQLRAQNTPVPPAQTFYPQVLDQLIMQQVQLDLIGRSGLKPDDNQVNAALMDIAQQNGFSSLSLFQQSIDAKQTGSYRALRQQIADSLSLKALQQQQIARRVKITDQDINLFLKSPESNALKQSSYHTLHIRVPFNAAQTAPTEKQRQRALAVANRIAEALQAPNVDVNTLIITSQTWLTGQDIGQIAGGDMGFHGAKELPTDIAKDIVALKVGEVSRPIPTPQGYNVIKLVGKQGDEKKIIDQWSVRHILVSPSASLSPEMAKQRINTLYEQLRQGADFATLAATYSEDMGSASKGGSLGWVSESEMVPEFEKVMKNTAVNDFSIPFQSQFGWHILKVEGKRQQDVTDLYQRNVAREVIYQRLAPQALEDWLQEIRAQAYVKVLDTP